MSDKIREALAGMLAIVDDSTGVAGYHLSGNIAEWGEFPEVEAARAALAQQPAPAAVTEKMIDAAIQKAHGYPADHLSREFYRLAIEGALAAPAAPVAQEPVAWGAFHFGGKRDGKLYSHSDTEAQIDAYILNVHRSSDSVTLRKGPLYAAPPAAEYARETARRRNEDN